MAEFPSGVFPGPRSTDDVFPSWFVPSRSVAPGAYWLVTLDQFGMHCGCPRGVQQEERPLPERESCRHQREAVRYEDTTKRRPIGKLDAEIFVG